MRGGRCDHCPICRHGIADNHRHVAQVILQVRKPGFSHRVCGLARHQHPAIWRLPLQLLHPLHAFKEGGAEGGDGLGIKAGDVLRVSEANQITLSDQAMEALGGPRGKTF